MTDQPTTDDSQPVPLLSQDVLQTVVPECSSPGDWVVPLNAAMARFDINDARRAAAFLAQIAHESNEFRSITENLNYSVAGLMNSWPKRFPTAAIAQQYARNPEKLANFVYALRLGNGDAESGDGWRYRGRGLIQLTGRGNYRAAGTALGVALEDNPDQLAQPDAAALSAAWFWKSHGLNELADDANPANDDEDFESISIKINGGRAGMDSRKAYWAKAKSALGITS
jgi:putative chitinase